MCKANLLFSANAMTYSVFIAGLAAGATLNLLLLRTILAPPFRIWPAPEPGSWQSLIFWSLFRGGMMLTLAVAALDWDSVHFLDRSRFIGVPLFLVGFGIAICGYFNLGLSNTYCGADGLVRHGLYRFSRNPQYTASIAGLFGLALAANSVMTICLAAMMAAAYVLMAFAEEGWLEQLYGKPYSDYCAQTARFLDVAGIIALTAERKRRRPA